MEKLGEKRHRADNENGDGDVEKTHQKRKQVTLESFFRGKNVNTTSSSSGSSLRSRSRLPAPASTTFSSSSSYSALSSSVMKRVVSKLDWQTFLIHNKAKHRFEYIAAGNGNTDKQAFVEYELQESSILNLYETFVPNTLRNNGIGEKMIDGVFQYAQQYSLRILPTCSFIRNRYLKSHPEKLSFVVESTTDSRSRPVKPNQNVAESSVRTSNGNNQQVVPKKNNMSPNNHPSPNPSVPPNHAPFLHHPVCQDTWIQICEDIQQTLADHKSDNTQFSFVSIQEILKKIILKSDHYLPTRNSLFYVLSLMPNEKTEFLQETFPFMLQTILDLPNIFPQATIPILRIDCTATLKLTRHQCFAILVLAFFDFHLKNRDRHRFSLLSFQGWYSNIALLANALRRRREGEMIDEYTLSHGKTEVQKLICILHYFMIHANRCKDPYSQDILNETVVFSRVALPLSLEEFQEQIQTNSKPATSVALFNPSSASSPTIEDEPFRYPTLQIDFANKYIGGGVLNEGCVQEEIRFVINPECLCSLLFCQVMNKNESITISFAERHAMYKGYAGTFKFNGRYSDRFPDRRQDCIVAIDAIRYPSFKRQFSERNLIREIYKAYAGFHVSNNILNGEILKGNDYYELTGDEWNKSTVIEALNATSSCDPGGEDFSHISTGNWGCGAFNGDVTTKFVIQLIAAALCGRHIRYYSFGDPKARPLRSFVSYLKENTTEELIVSQLWTYLLDYAKLIWANNREHADLCSYIVARRSSNDQNVDMTADNANEMKQKERIDGEFKTDEETLNEKPLLQQTTLDLNGYLQKAVVNNGSVNDDNIEDDDYVPNEILDALDPIEDFDDIGSLSDSNK